MSTTFKQAAPLFQVFDTRASVAFYTETLGATVDQTWEPDGRLYWASLTLGGVRLMLNAKYEDHERPDAPDPGAHAGHGDVEWYLEVEDVDGFHAQLSERIPDLPPPKEQHGRREIVVTDPDGYKLSFYAT